MTPTTLNQDARNRALRTFLQGLAIDLAVAVAALVLANVDKITDEQGLRLFAIGLAKTVVTTIASYVMRRFLDASSIPTPLPPAPVPAPNEEEPPVAGDIERAVIMRDKPLPPADRNDEV